MFEEGQGICQQEKWRDAAVYGAGMPWDSRLHRDGRGEQAKEAVAKRHNLARQLCQRCPLLEACERYLSATERAGIRVDGVVAGRYSDTPSHGWILGPAHIPDGNEEGRQTNCRACGQPMWPQVVSPERATERGGQRHVGEGLCEICFPRFARHNRRRC